MKENDSIGEDGVILEPRVQRVETQTTLLYCILVVQTVTWQSRAYAHTMVSDM